MVPQAHAWTQPGLHVVWQKLISAHCQYQNIRIRGSVGGRDANGWRVQVLETEERRVSRPL